MAKQKNKNNNNNDCTCRMSHAKRTCVTVAPYFQVTEMIANFQINMHWLFHVQTSAIAIKKITKAEAAN